MAAVRFGDSFELDPAAYWLRRSGQTLRLERIPMDVLLLLMEHRGELVTREQIVERVWGKGTFLDADNSINGAIRKIRQVLEDDPERSRFIQTVTGRGYRFAPLRDSESPARALPRRASARAWIAAGLAALVVGVATAHVLVRRSRNLPAATRVMVAVLPFDNLTGDTRQEYFSDGLTEEMITQLGERDPEHLGVIARASVMQYKNDRAPMNQIVRELGVAYVLEGSVRRDPDHIRITTQLIRASDQSQLWARQYDRQPADLLTLQGEIAQAITNEIEASLGRPLRAVMTFGATGSNP
jgi:TolB-like protein/DNA-binding winged helix-turn-helix (wHTH) protein